MKIGEKYTWHGKPVETVHSFSDRGIVAIKEVGVCDSKCTVVFWIDLIKIKPMYRGL